MQTAVPIHTDLVLVGGGHSHAIVLRRLGMQPLPSGVQLTLITNLTDTPYSGMLPCHISGRYDFDTAHIDLRPLTRFAQCRLFMDEMVGLDLDNQRVLCRRHPPVAYDLLSLDIGSTPTVAAVPGAAENAIAAKPVPHLLQAWQTYLDTLAAQPTATIGIVGGGVGGVELALNMQARLWQLMEQQGLPCSKVVVHLFHRGSQLATGRNRLTQWLLARKFRDRGIHTHLNESVCAVEPGRVICESGLTVECDRVFWVTNAAAPEWIADTGLATDSKGFIAVEDTLQSCSHPNIFAAGDIATMVNYNRPKAGVFAVRQGRPLAENLRRYLAEQPLQAYRPQKRFLNIIDTGTGTAIASRGPFAGESRLFRWWKDRIDQKFMGLFKEFPPMRPEQPEAVDSIQNAKPTMYCAGCGSKVGSLPLKKALQRVRAEAPSDADWPHREDIFSGLEQPDDAAVVRVPAGKLAVQTVDQFRAMLDDPYVFGQICVNHCLSDIFAMGATAAQVLAIATISYGTDAKQEETLYQLLSGAMQALAQSKTFLVGGHTTEGPELSLGFACNGWVEPDQIWRKSGLQPGQSLILTKPLGTGTLFAADMQLAAKGRWIDAAVASMAQSNQNAADCLRRYSTTACTDVTGFGLVGHLLEMVQASQADVILDLARLPVLSGARQTLAQGWVSSLQERNRQAAAAIRNTISSHPDYPLLFDPQTAGGLLAAVPAAETEACLHQLHRLGYPQSRCIGRVDAALVRPTITINE